MSNETDLIKACIDAVQGQFDDLAEQFKETMGNEIHSKEGTLKSCMCKEKISDTRYFVGIDQNQLKAKAGFDYSNAYWKGRKEVRPKRKNTLHWVEDGKDVFAKKAKATSGDPFVERAIQKFK